MKLKYIIGGLLALTLLCGVQYFTANATSCLYSGQGGTGCPGGAAIGYNLYVASTTTIGTTTIPLYGYQANGSGGGGSSTGTPNTIGVYNASGTLVGSTTLQFKGNLISGVATETNINIAAGTLDSNQAGGAKSVDWNDFQLFDTTGIPAISWNSRDLTDPSNVTAADWGNRVLTDSAGNQQIVWSSPGQIYLPEYTTNSLLKTTGGSGLLQNAVDGIDYYSPTSFVDGTNYWSPTSLTSNSQLSNGAGYLTSIAPFNTNGTSIGLGTTTYNQLFNVQGTSSFIGNVGIGATNPTKTLTLNSNSTSTGAQLQFGDSATSTVSSSIVMSDLANRTLTIEGPYSGSGAMITEGGTGSAFTIGTTGAGTINLETSSTVQQCITNTGIVGIGDVNCTGGAKLYVVGSESIGNTAANARATPATGGLLVQGEIVEGTTTTSTSYSGVFMGGNFGIGTTTPAATLSVVGTQTVSQTSTFSGNVGIGTTAPSSTLHVVGDVQFSGSSTVTTPSIGGTITTSGCDSATTTVESGLSSSTTQFITTPEVYVGPVSFYSVLTSPTLITTYVCADITITPTSTPYIVKIIK